MPRHNCDDDDKMEKVAQFCFPKVAVLKVLKVSIFKIAQKVPKYLWLILYVNIPPRLSNKVQSGPTGYGKTVLQYWSLSVESVPEVGRGRCGEGFVFVVLSRESVSN